MYLNGSVRLLLVVLLLGGKAGSLVLFVVCMPEAYFTGDGSRMSPSAVSWLGFPTKLASKACFQPVRTRFRDGVEETTKKRGCSSSGKLGRERREGGQAHYTRRRYSKLLRLVCPLREGKGRADVLPEFIYLILFLPS